MALADEVKAFARDFVNGNQTRERKDKIRAVYYQLTGERLRDGCSTCYVEATIKILRLMEKQPCKYRLLKGAVLSVFGDASKTVTNERLTDELAEWHLRNVRGCAAKFLILPEGAPQYGDPEPGAEIEKELDIVPVTKTEKTTVKVEHRKTPPRKKGKK